MDGRSGVGVAEGEEHGQQHGRGTSEREPPDHGAECRARGDASRRQRVEQPAGDRSGRAVPAVLGDVADAVEQVGREGGHAAGPGRREGDGGVRDAARAGPEAGADDDAHEEEHDHAGTRLHEAQPHRPQRTDPPGRPARGRDPREQRPQHRRRVGLHRDVRHGGDV